jgi:hypothetical protein
MEKDERKPPKNPIPKRPKLNAKKYQNRND